MFKGKLYDYQAEAVEFAQKNLYAILALEMGLGKTACALAIAESLKDCRCLIVAPAYLVLNWRKEISKFIEGKVTQAFKNKKDIYFPFDCDYCIVSYDMAAKHEYLFEWANMVVLDEATAIKSMKAKRTQAIHKLVYENSIERCYLLTGTPIKNRVQEFYSLIALCNYRPGIDSSFLKKFESEVDFADYFSYREEFGRTVKNRRIQIIRWIGLKKEDELKTWLKDIYISKKSTMAKINYIDVTIDDYNDDELREEFENFQKGISRVAPQVKAKAALRKAPLTCRYVKDLIDDGEIEGPVVIYTDHREACKFIANFFNTTAITGEMNVVLRQQMADDFQEGLIPVLVATIGSFSTGYTLTRSNTMVFNDLAWTPGDLAQAEFRINRIGQTRPVYVHRMLGSEQDEYILKTILGKTWVLEKVF